MCAENEANGMPGSLGKFVAMSQTSTRIIWNSHVWADLHEMSKYSFYLYPLYQILLLSEVTRQSLIFNSREEARPTRDQVQN